ncbi:putative inactive poly [ADP-ribose] polymerase SRO2 [Iris pallida]|uniref:Inactive poly [ADP-ribose] polymerase SRO2 n=1 Tax=Iris pallida TaxID=29817 RepID=A0AAX6E764_IRIPA|nr:putative inactive poly [ADP-ribose] polymerase SRO2 [Iris pallida]
MEAVSPRLSNSSTTDEEFSSGGGANAANNAVELSSPRSCSVELLPAVGGGSGDRTVVQYFNNFKKSGVPCRFLLFEQNAWVDFPKLVFDELSAGFVAGKAVFELSADGRCYLFDFLRMVRIDTLTEAANSIAWIDVDGRCFFPRTVVAPEESYHQCYRQKEMEELEIGNIDKSFSDESSGLAWPRFSGAEMLGEGERLYRVVRKLFLNGMRRACGSSDADVAVMSVHKCSYPGLSGRSRLKAFQMMMAMAKEARGDANVKFGWYGASASNVADVVEHGFGKTNSGELGFGAHGLGVHLSPPQHPHGSSVLCREGAEGGEKYMVLCRVVMGNMERVEAGSLQRHPSSDEFDSGVDDLDNPKWYVVWSTGMNTRIIPEYVVSFKTCNQAQGTRRGAAAAATATRRAPPVRTWLSFPKLLKEIEKSLPSPKTRALERLYNQHKLGKMSKDIFIRYIRSIVGDKLLASTIRRIR